MWREGGEKEEEEKSSSSSGEVRGTRCFELMFSLLLNMRILLCTVGRASFATWLAFPPSPLLWWHAQQPLNGGEGLAQNNHALCCYKETGVVPSIICDATRGIHPHVAVALVQWWWPIVGRKEENGKVPVLGESATKLTIKTVPISLFIWSGSVFVTNFALYQQTNVTTFSRQTAASETFRAASWQQPFSRYIGEALPL